MSLLNKVYISPILVFLAFSCTITGLFKTFLIVFCIIIFHELGHLFFMLIFKRKINKVSLYPFGGIVDTNSNINSKYSEDLLIAVGGILFQLILVLIVTILLKFHIISTLSFYTFKSYNYTILLFNLLPIIPLDGSKILNLVMYKILPYSKSNILIIFISLITILICSIFIKYQLNFYILIIFFVYKIYKEFKDSKYKFNKFILERYLFNYNFKKIKILKNNNINKMMLYKRHLFKINNIYITEKEFLKNKFDIK